MDPNDLQSYVRFMRERLFDHVDIPAGAWHVPDGTVPREVRCLVGGLGAVMCLVRMSSWWGGCI
jgi:hypothetical protein